MTTYSQKEDLLVGDTALGAGADPQKHVQDATDEINSVIGIRYAVPVDLGLAPVYARLTLKQCANLIASGRLIMAAASKSPNAESIHAYGYSLLQEGHGILLQLRDGMIDLGTPSNPGQTNDNQGAPSIHNVDEVSGVEAFYGGTVTVARADGYLWGPGALP